MMKRCEKCGWTHHSTVPCFVDLPKGKKKMNMQNRNSNSEKLGTLFLRAGMIHENKKANVVIGQVDEIDRNGNIVVGGRIIIHGSTESEVKEMQAKCVKYLQRRRDEDIIN